MSGDTENMGSIPGSGRSPEEGNGNPLQYSSLENSEDREAWQAIVHHVAKSRTQLTDWECVRVHERAHNPYWAQLYARPWADHSLAMETLPRVNTTPLFNLTNVGAYCFLTVWTKWFERLNSTSYRNTFQNPKLSFIIKWHMNNKNKFSCSGLKTENTLHLDNWLK